jgi:hypothetical protein
VAGSAALVSTSLAQSLSPQVATAADPVADAAATLGHDLDRIFRFVQEDVRY